MINQQGQQSQWPPPERSYGQPNQQPPQWQQLMPPQQVCQSQPPMYPPSQYQPQKSKSRKRLWVIISVVVLVLIVIGGIALQVGNSNHTTTQPTRLLKWTTVQTFTGNGTKKTAAFHVGNDWKIVWSCIPSSFSGGQYNLIVGVNNSNNTILDVGAVTTICKQGNITDSIEEHQGGDVYLDINSEGAWKVQIQEPE